jgi:hypothetical protein
MIRLTQTRMKIHHASSIRPIKKNLFTDEKNNFCSNWFNFTFKLL